MLRVTFLTGGEGSDLSVTKCNIFNGGRGQNSSVTLKNVTQKYAFSVHGRLQMSMVCITKHLQKRQNFSARGFGAREELYTYFEQWGDKKHAFVSPCDRRNLKFGLLQAFSWHFSSLQSSLHICTASLSKNGTRERNQLFAKFEYLIKNMRSTCTYT